MKILCTICARSGSVGVKNKSIKKIYGKPLIEYTIKQAKKINFINTIIVSTDSKKIINISSKLGINNSFIRSKKLSNNYASKILVIRDALLKAEKFNNNKFDIIIDLDITSPLRCLADIRKSYEKFIKKKSDILFSVTKSKKNPYFNMVEIKNKKISLIKEKKNIVRRQSAPIVYDMNASIYIWRRKSLLKKNTLFSKKTSLYLMPEERSIDIDSNLDFKLVEYLLKTKK